ncbi:DUF3592 domain-containing protein [Streptomyces sp. NPDC017524]|uniref:DUF3592 domain-containing protein n=1 Tax=unclassified Streptomyces TaxID=2593676 RepID=UPI0037A996EC
MDLSDSSFAWIFLLIIGAIFVTPSVREIRRTRKLRQTGAKAYGRIVGHHLGESDNGNTTYAPVVDWQTPDGVRREYRASSGNTGKGRFKVGRNVVIHYYPADPDASAALRGYDGGWVAWLALVPGTAAIAGGLFEMVEMLLVR